jgi:hypothetical protein
MRFWSRSSSSSSNILISFLQISQSCPPLFWTISALIVILWVSNNFSFSRLLTYFMDSVKSLFSFLISFFKRTRVPVESSLITALFLISLALYANFKVERVSPKLRFDGEMLAMITVLLLPPRESLRIKVSLLSRYGTCLFLPSDTSTKELITFPRAERDLLIIPASFSLSPWVPASFYLSEPAKSMMWNLDCFTFHTPVADLDLLSMIVVRTEWDLELCLFMDVAPTCLLRAPLSMRAIISSWLSTTSSQRLSTYTPLLISSLTCKLTCEGSSKSMIYSLYISKKLHFTRNCSAYPLLFSSISDCSALMQSKMYSKDRCIIPLLFWNSASFLWFSDSSAN